MDEKYQRIKVLGKGSFGKAYLVKNTEINEKCVVKQMETSMMDPKERNEAVKEALLLKRMDHPNIVRFQEVFMTRKGRLCIVMDYADGGDVHMEIKRQEGKLLPESRILEWFVQTSFALKHVHGRKVLHRDLKTQNIFLMATGQIKLGDFGIARVLDATKDYAKTMVGTPYYLSPEIIEDKPYNFKSDVWSLGVVLYEMTTLKHPFDAESLVILASKILKDQYPRPDPMYTQELQDMISRMLSKDASKRPTIGEVLVDPFLQETMRESNEKYALGLDLSEFAVAVPASPPADASLRPSLADRRREEVAAASAGAAPGDDDTVLMGTVKPEAAANSAAPEASTPTGSATGRKETEEEYEDEFEDYSGSEDGDKNTTALQHSVANLRLDGGGSAGTKAAAPPLSGISEEASAGAAAPNAADMAGSRVAAKAEALRTYLSSQVPAPDFERAYRLVKGASSAALPADELQPRVAEIIGAEKAPELFTLFQLLCFLEDYASNNAS